MRSLLYSLWISSLLLGVTESISCGDVEIKNGQDAAEVRRDCKVITGNLVFRPNFTETIHLEGVEEIQGDLVHANECYYDDCIDAPPFSISISTLHTVGGKFSFLNFVGLQELLLPNLTRVEEQVLFERMHSLERLDITKLSRFQALHLDAGNLTFLSHEVLEGFTGEGFLGPFVDLRNASIDSVDSFFKRPTTLPDEDTHVLPILISSNNLPNLRNVTIGWSKIDTIEIVSKDLSVTFGNSNTTTMEIENLKLDGNYTKLEYLVAPENLTVHNLTLGWANSGLTHLDLPFHNTSQVDIIFQRDLKSMSNTPGAQDWENFDLNIFGCPNLQLTSEYADGRRVWYWPQKNMKSIHIYDAVVSNDFFASFLASHANGTQGPKIESFFVWPRPGQGMKFDCAPFEELRLRGVFPERFDCTNSMARSIRGDIPSSWFLGMGWLFYILF